MDRFVEWTVRYLRTSEPRHIAGSSDDELRLRVEHACGRGIEHGLVHSRLLLRFVMLVLSTGPGLDEHPEIARILADRSRDPEARVDALLGRPDLIAEITAAAGPNPWSPLDSHGVSPRHR